MFSRDETVRIKQEFWTTYGKYMAPVPSSDDEPVNWINYKTGIKNVFFKMKTFKRSVVIGIFILHDDAEIQEIFYQQFLANKRFFENTIGEEWTWALHVPDENGKLISSISKEKSGVSIMNKDDWPEIISFFKARIIALDEFWAMAKDSFDELR